MWCINHMWTYIDWHGPFWHLQACTGEPIWEAWVGASPAPALIRQAVAASPPSRAAACSAIMLPKNEYPLWDSLGDDIIDSGKLSRLQLEGVRYACNKHLEILSNGQRAGFFIGDGAGVGKGRQIAGAQPQ
jgi:P-loop containing NTP hydrolase pore-1